MSTPRRLIVTGATGKQGGAVISALLSKASQPFEIYAVTRDTTTRSALALATKPSVKVIQGDFGDPVAIFKQVEKPWGLFLVSMLGDAKVEEQLGKATTKAAVDAGVQHIVFTATERGGQTESHDTPTYVPHFISKFNIERDIMEKPVTWTFLRPVAFMENLTKDFNGKAFMAMWRINGVDRKTQLISTVDIGKIGAEALLNADKDEYRNKGVSIAGDEISPYQAGKIFKEVTGQDIPLTYSIIGYLVRWMVKDMGYMFNWIYNPGFGVDVQAVRKRYPFMQDFKTWLETESAWKKA